MSLSATSAPSIQASLSGTPIQLRSGSTPDTPTVSGHTIVKEKMASDLRDEIIGPMPVEEFFKEFMPVEGKMPSLKANYFDGIPKATKARARKKLNKGEKSVVERDMYDELITLMNKLMTSLTAVNTSTHYDKNSASNKHTMPDLSIYKTEDFDKLSNASSNPTHFDKMQTIIEVKPEERVKPFIDPPLNATPEELLDHKLQASGVEAAQCRGQLGVALAEICARQNRTHVFMVFIADPQVRFLRADRAGVIVTRAYNFRTSSKELAQFLWRFDKLSEEQRGIDPSVRMATESEMASARPALMKWKKEKLDRALLVMDVHDDKGNIHKAAVWHALSEPRSLTGRATRPYAAYNLKTKEVMFIKDTWRTSSLGMEKESDILRELNRAGVRHVPKLYSGEDVPGCDGNPQMTRTQEFVNAAWRCGPRTQLDSRTHHRLLEGFYGQCLAEFSTPKAMMQAVHHAFIAHREAYEICGILHRDISNNNVLIAPTEGVLSDWDLAIRVKRDGKDIDRSDARQRYRTGTWFFMSIQLLRDPGKLHLLQDDLESFFYLVLWVSLQFLPFTAESTWSIFKASVFNENYAKHGHSVGGSGKSAMILTDQHIKDLSFDDNVPLTAWVNTALDAFRQFHQYMDAQSRAASSAPARITIMASTSAIAPLNNSTTATLAFEQLALSSHNSLDSYWQWALEQNGWPDNRRTGPPDDDVDTLPLALQTTRGGSSRGSKRGIGEIEEPESPSLKKSKSGSHRQQVASGSGSNPQPLPTLTRQSAARKPSRDLGAAKAPLKKSKSKSQTRMREAASGSSSLRQAGPPSPRRSQRKAAGK